MGSSRTDEAEAAVRGSPETDREIRDALLYWLVDNHAVTYEQILEAQIGFASKKTIRRRVGKLQKRQRTRRLRCVGHVQLTEERGRPAHVFCNGFYPKPDELAHEVVVTESLLWAIRLEKYIERGFKTNRTIRPDATVYHVNGILGTEGEVLHVEGDRATEPYKQIKARLKTLAKANEFVLWVVPDAVRLLGIRERAATVEGKWLFTTLEHVNEFWIDMDKQKVLVGDLT